MSLGLDDGWVWKESLAVTDGDGNQMLRGRMGTETMSDGDGYNWCSNGWGWVNFPLLCRSLIYNRQDQSLLWQLILFEEL